MPKQVAVIGGGPGGYVAAIRLAQLGASVTLVEQDVFGGTCLNRGCIPTKVLLHAAELLRQVRFGGRFGLVSGDASIDWAILQQHKSSIVSGLVNSVGSLLRANGIKTVQATASFIDQNTLSLIDLSGKHSNLSADAFIIATGAQPAIPPVPGLDSPGILTSDDALSLESLPESMIMIGGGVIGVEFAHVLSAMGVQVTIVEAQPEILPLFDEQLAGLLRQKLTSQGVVFYTGAAVAGVEQTSGGYTVLVTVQDGIKHSLSARQVMVCTGRKPNTGALSLDAALIQTERGRIVVNDQMQTNQPHIYAIGDCASPVQLAHVASKEGEVAAQNIVGAPKRMSYHAIPACVYTAPELASVGLTERSARNAGYDVCVGCFQLNGNAKTKIIEEVGLFKVVVDARYGEILGVHLLGPRATELIAEATLAIEAEITADQLVETIHAHPTVSEAIAEAFMDVEGKAVHLPPCRKSSS